jgi:hypothetical protein
MNEAVNGRQCRPFTSLFAIRRFLASCHRSGANPEGLMGNSHCLFATIEGPARDRDDHIERDKQ